MTGYRNLQRAIDNLGEDLGQLVDQHEEARDPSSWEEYADDPVGFAEEVLGVEPWDAQREIMRSVQDESLTVVRSANAVGKDWTVAQLALWFVYARRGLVLLTGPTERQVVEILFREIARSFSSTPELPGQLYQSALKLGQGAEAGILGFTSSSASKLTGFHSARVMAAITEAQDVEDFAWEGMLSCTTGHEDRVLAVGNPLQPTGRFYRASNASQWSSLRIPASAHPNVQQGAEVIPGGVSEAFVERMAAEYGEDSPIFRARVEGEFPEDSADGLVRRSWLQEAAKRWEEEEPSESEDGDPVVAVDVARYGSDKTVVAVRRGSTLTRLLEWDGLDTMATVGRLRELLDEEGVRTLPDYEQEEGEDASLGDIETVVVDTVGVGGGVFDRLRELEYSVKEFKGGERPQRRYSKRFKNKRSHAAWVLRKRLEQRGIGIPADDELFEELRRCRWGPTSDSRTAIERKDDLRQRLGRSPDKFDAVTMAFYAEYLPGGLYDLITIMSGPFE